MDSNSKPRVTLSTAQAVQPKSSTLSGSSFSGSFLIRAPLTIDDDDDDYDNDSFISEPNADRMAVDVSDSGYGTYSSVSSNGSEEGFVSGEEFETASERPFLAAPAEEIVEERNGFVEKYKFSMPPVAVPYEEIVEESDGFVHKYEFSRPFVAVPDGEFSEKSVVDDEGNSIGDEYDGPVVDLGLVENVTIKPIAQLSLDDDGLEFDELSGGEERMGSEVEDGGFSLVIKVPTFGTVDSAPRIKVMDIEGGEDELLSESLSPEKFVDGLVSSKFFGVRNADLGASAEAIFISNSQNDTMSDELVEDLGSGSTPKAQSKSFVDGKEDVSKFGKNFVAQGPALQNFVQEKFESNDEDGYTTEEDNARIAFVPASSPIKELKVEEAGAGKEEPSDCQNNQCSIFEDSGSFSLDRNSDQDNLEISNELEIDLAVHLCDPSAIISGESIDGAMNEEKIHNVDSYFLEPNPSLQSSDLHTTIEGYGLEDAESSAFRSLKFVNSSTLDLKAESEAEDDTERTGRIQKGLLSDEDVDELIFRSSGTTKKMIHGLEERLASSSLVASENIEDHSQGIDGQFVMDLDDKLDAVRDGEGNELFDSAAVVALLKSANSAASDGGDLTITSANYSRVLALEHHDGSGFVLPSSRSILSRSVDGDVPQANVSEEERRIEKIQLLRVKFLRLVRRLGRSYDDSMVVQVLYRLALAFGNHSSQAFSIVAAKRLSAQHEEENKDDLDFSLNILVLGKTGVGKSATINSIFCEEKGRINAFEPATASVKVIAGAIHGVKTRILDTPGLKYPVMGRNVNEKILASIKKSMKKFPPDVVLYVDRLDTHTGDYNDLPLLRSLTDSLGTSIWKNAIVCLTHAASDTPDGPTGFPLSYELFVAQQAHAIQRSISLAVDDLPLMNPSMMHPVSLVENHQSCPKNQTGESVLPNGQSWRPQLILMCFSLKILTEVNSVSKPLDPFTHEKLSAFRSSAPLSYFLSSLLQSRTHPKHSADQGEDDVDSDIELGDSPDSEQDEDEYDELPLFKPLKKSQVAKLSKEQRKAYFEEYDYRIKVLEKKQWKEQVKRLREIKKKGDLNNIVYQREDEDPENESPATAPVMLPDFVLPPSFDGDNPQYRYRLLGPTSQLLVRPVLDSHSWDHDCGYDGVSLEGNFALAGQFPGAFAVQITKDKKDFNIHLDSSISAKHGENRSTMAGVDFQTVGRQLAYALRGETKFRNFKINKTSAGLAITLLGENVATGLKIEDQIAVGNRLVLAGNAGPVQSRGDTAYGANLELRLKDKDFPIGQNNSSLGLSMVSWRGNLNLMADLQSQFTMGRSSKLAVCVGLNSKRSGQITLKLSSSEQLQMALIGVLPIAISIFRSIYPGSGGTNSPY